MSSLMGSRIGSHPELPDVGGWWRDDVAKPVGPLLQRLALLGLVAVNVVDLVDALLRMAEDQLGDEGRDAERRQISAGGSSQIVEAPIGQLGGTDVDCGLVQVEVANAAAAAGGREHEITAGKARERLEQVNGHAGERHLMRGAALGATCRNDPKRIIEVDLAPGHMGGLATADRRQKQEARKRPGRVDAFSALPEQCNLRVGKHALARGHGADELARLDKLAGIALDVAELARDAEAIDAGRERERLGRHVGAGLPVDFLEHGDGVGALDLGGNASAPPRDKMSLDGLFDLGCGALLGGSGTAQKCLGERTEGVDRVPALLRMHARHEIAERRAGELARRGQADVGIAAEHRADRARVAGHTPHNKEGDHAAVGDSAAERRLCRVPMDAPLARRSRSEALEVAVGENGALGGGHGWPRKKDVVARGYMGATLGLCQSMFYDIARCAQKTIAYGHLARKIVACCYTPFLRPTSMSMTSCMGRVLRK